MTNEIIFIIEPDAGMLTVEVSNVPTLMIADLESDCGKATGVNCGRPAPKSNTIRDSFMDNAKGSKSPDNRAIWLYRLYHNSVVDGPGRRSVIQVAGCSIRCKGCYVPETHDRQNGTYVSIISIVDEIVSKRNEHDGVTILGGEPFDQSGPIAEIVSRLNRQNLHITIYSGYTLETLITRKDSSTDYILTHSDLLIDGPFIYQASHKAGEYRGSRNQRILVNLGRTRFG